MEKKPATASAGESWTSSACTFWRTPGASREPARPSRSFLPATPAWWCCAIWMAWMWTSLPSQSCAPPWMCRRSEEHTSELQSHSDLVCRLLLEKKKKDRQIYYIGNSKEVRCSVGCRVDM